MHTIKLQVQDSIYSHVMFFLNSLQTKELKVLEDKEVDMSHQAKDSSETQAFSNHSVSLIDDWKDENEDDVWK